MQLTALWADTVMRATLPVSYFHFRLFCLVGGGGGSDVEVFIKVMHKSNLGSGRATTFFGKNF